MIVPKRILTIVATGLAWLAIAAEPGFASAPMTVTLVHSDATGCGMDCPSWISLKGRIVAETPDLLAGVLARMQGRRVPILVDSPGGSVEAALAMGRMIRARKLDVVVAGTLLGECAATDGACLSRSRGGERPGSVVVGPTICASACVFVLAAGTDRVVGRNAVVGVHQMTTSHVVTPSINVYRTVRKVVNGRIVVVKTLAGTRPGPSSEVTSAAPNETYTEVDRYLLGMGIDESIMPLMHGTPPADMHWMSPTELETTRIATGTSDAKSFVDRTGVPAMPATLPAAATGISALSLDGSHRSWLGTATWRIETAAAAPPRLVVDIGIPERSLTGHLTIARATDPGATAAYTGVIGFVPTAAAPAVVEARPPRLCDPKICLMPMTTGRSSDAVGGASTFDVPLAWGDGFLSGLRRRDWLEVPVRTSEGWGVLTLATTGEPGTTIATWERLCCGLVVPDGPARKAPVPAFPAPPPDVVDRPPPAPMPLPPAAADASRAPYSASLDPATPPMQGLASVSWIPFAAAAAATDASEHPSLLADIDVPEADFRIEITARPAESGHAGDIAFDFEPVADPKTFGPAAFLSVSPISGSPAGDAVRLISSTQRPGGFTIDVAIDPDAPAGSAVRFDFSDSEIRTVTVTIPIDDQIRSLAKAAGRRAGATN